MCAAETSPVRGRPRSSALAAVVASVAVQSALLVGVAVFFAVEMVAAHATDLAAAAAIAVLALLVGGFLAACARALWRGRRWARGPVLTWQLLMLLAVVPSLVGERTWIAAGLVLVCVVAGGGLLLPTVVARTTGGDEPPAI